MSTEIVNAVAVAISLVSGLANAAKSVLNIRDDKVRAEIQASLREANNQALQLQECVARLQQENADLREQLRAKNKADELDEKLYYAGSAFWRKDEPTGPAYCPTCWKTKNLLVPLVDDSGNGRCRVCNVGHWNVYAQSRPKEGDPATAPRSPDQPRSTSLSRRQDLMKW